MLWSMLLHITEGKIKSFYAFCPPVDGKTQKNLPLKGGENGEIRVSPGSSLVPAEQMNILGHLLL